MSKDYHRTDKLSFVRCKNATVLPRKQIGTILYKERGGVIDETGNFVEFSGDYDLIHPERADVLYSQFVFGGILLRM